jgi:polyisoprenoid-binding protein YceI
VTEAMPAEASPTEAPAAVEPTAAPVAEKPTAAVATEAPAVATEAPAAAGGARTFVIVPGESQAGYEVDEEFLAGAAGMLGIEPGKGKTVGSTDQVNGQLTLDFSGTPQITSGEFQVDISTLKSDQNRRDNRIRTEWLQSATFPVASFKAAGLQNAPASYTEGEEVTFQLAGDLTIREITQPVVFDVKATLQGDTITGTATTAFLMSQFGVDPPAMGNLFTVGDNTVVTLTLVAKEE